MKSRSVKARRMRGGEMTDMRRGMDARRSRVSVKMRSAGMDSANVWRGMYGTDVWSTGMRSTDMGGAKMRGAAAGVSAAPRMSTTAAARMTAASSGLRRKSWSSRGAKRQSDRAKTRCNFPSRF